MVAHAFHPLEALLEATIIPVVVLLLPVNYLVLIAFGLWAILWNIIGHLGYEFFPPGWVQHPLGRYVNTSTHHNQRHQDGRYNFGLYCNVWDRLLGTNHPNYEEVYAEVTRELGTGS